MPMARTNAREILRLGARGWTAILSVVLFTAALDLTNSYLQAVTAQRSWRFSTAMGIVTCWVTYLLLLPTALLFANRFRLDLDGRRGRHLAIHAVAALTFAYFQCWTVAVLVPNEATTLTRFFQSARVNFPCDVLSYWFIVGATYAFHFYSKVRAREVETVRLDASLTEARLAALQAQLNPHFLFNTLNAISSLALTGNREAVAEMIARLGDLLRASFRNQRAHEIRAVEEMRLLDSYLDIQALLLGDGLTIRRTVATETLDALVPCMLLQPIVENAIVHGVGARGGRGVIAIDVSRTGGALRLRVSDSGPGFQPTAVRQGVGLANTQARLEQLYGALHTVEYGRSPGGGAVVTIKIPFKEAAVPELAPSRRVS